MRKTVEHILGIIAVIMLPVLAGCQKETIEREHGTEPVSLMLYDQLQTEVATRAGIPSGWNTYIPNEAGLPTSIKCFFTEPGGSRRDDGVFTYKKKKDETTGVETGKWESTLRVDPGTWYSVFGFMPATNLENDAIEGELVFDSEDSGDKSDPHNTVTLKIKGLNSVNNVDVAAIVGIGEKNYYENFANANDVTDLNDNALKGRTQLGYFCYVGQKNHNNIVLLVKHLYACVDMKFSVDEEYSKLRTIKLTKITLTSSNSGLVDATLKLKPLYTSPDRTVIPGSKSEIPSTLPEPLANYTVYGDPLPEDPLPSDNIGFTIYPSATGSDEAVILDEPEGKLLDVVGIQVPGFFTPTKMVLDEDGNISPTGNNELVNLSITTEYNVYDKAGNLLSTRTAVNKLPQPLKSDGTPEDIVAGTKYTLPIKVVPTYLYQLSDADLDNPTLVIGE